MKIELEHFGGMAPLVDPTKLQDHFASYAENVVFNRGVISQNPVTPVLDFGVSGGEDTNQIRSIVWVPDGTRFGFSRPRITGGFQSLVLPRDEWDRVYLHTPEGIRVTTTRANIGGQGVNGYYRDPQLYQLGIPAPSSPIQVSPVTVDPSHNVEDAPLDTLMVQWVYTLVDGFGHESPPSPVSTSADVPYNAAWRVNLSGFLASGLQGTLGPGRIRIYRGAFDGETSAFQFVTEVAASANTVVDGTLGGGSTGVGLGQEMELIPSLDWYPPPDGTARTEFDGPIQGLESVASNFLAGFYDNVLCYSEFKMPHAWPTSYRYPLRHKIVGVVATDNGVLVATEGRPYWAVGADPASAVPIELNHSHPCLSAGSIVHMNGMGVYAAPDGLVGVIGGQAEVLTKQHITREDWLNHFNPHNIQAFSIEGRYYFSVGEVWWVFDPADAGGFSRVKIGGINPSEVVDTSHDYARDRVVLIDTQHRIHSLSISPSGDMAWRSKLFEEAPTSYSCARVIADTYPVQFELVRGGVTEQYVATSSRPFRLRAGLSDKWQFGIRASGGHIRAIGIAQSPEEFQ